MSKYLTRHNIGFGLSVAMGLFLMISVFGKLSGAQEVKDLLGSNGLSDWIFIIGIGELVSVLLFVYPKTMKIGTLLLSAYWGGAIMFHMTHENPEHQPFIGAAVFLVLTWVIAFLRGFNFFK